MMKKLLFFLLVLGVIAIVGCAPVQPGTSREGALAGKAVELGCDTQSVISCEDLGSGKVKVQYDSNTLSRELGPSCNTDEFGNPVAVQFSCANTKAGQAVSACSQQCVDGEACQSGACVAVAAEPTGPTIMVGSLVQTAAWVEVVPSASGTSVVVEANDVPILEAPAAADLGSVIITSGMTRTGGAAVAVTGLEGVEHFVYVPNTRSGGVFTCPGATTTIAETFSTCNGVIRHSLADCRAGIGGCSIVGNQYRVRSIGSSHGEDTAACGARRCDGNTLINDTATCEPLTLGAFLVGGELVFPFPAGSIDCTTTTQTTNTFPSTNVPGICLEFDAELSYNRESGTYEYFNSAGCVPCGSLTCRNADGIVNIRYSGGGDCPEGQVEVDRAICPQRVSCTDTDPANDMALGGEVTVVFSDGSETRSQDFCNSYDLSAVRQMSCGAENQMVGTTTLCPGVTTCSDSDGLGPIPGRCL